MKKNLNKGSKLPTKKQEKEFVESLKAQDKTYSVFERSYWTESGNWDGVVLDNWLKRFLSRFKMHKNFDRANLTYFDD